MSYVDITLDQEGNAEAFDRELARDGDLVTNVRLFTKKMPDGSARVLLVGGKARILLTATNFVDAAHAVKGAHPNAGERKWPEQPAGTEISGFHRGLRWRAVHQEHMYLVTTDAAKGQVSIAGDEAHARGLGEMMIDKSLPGRG